MVRLRRRLHESDKFEQLVGIEIGDGHVRHARLCPRQQVIALGRHRRAYRLGIVSGWSDKEINDMFATFVDHGCHWSLVQIVKPSSD